MRVGLENLLQLDELPHLKKRLWWGFQVTENPPEYEWISESTNFRATRTMFGMGMVCLGTMLTIICKFMLTYPHGNESIPIYTIFRGINIHLPAILMFTRGTRFWHTAIYLDIWSNSKTLAPCRFNLCWRSLPARVVSEKAQCPDEAAENLGIYGFMSVGRTMRQGLL